MQCFLQNKTQIIPAIHTHLYTACHVHTLNTCARFETSTVPKCMEATWLRF